MAEFLTMAEAEDKFGKKGRTNAALTLGIIGTALGAFTSYGTGMYAGTAAANFNAVNTAINTVADRCPSCTAQ